MTRRRSFVAAALLAIALAGCSVQASDDTAAPASTASAAAADPGSCVPIDMAVSSEKIAVMTQLAAAFNSSAEAKLEGGGCAFVRPRSKSSGATAAALAAGWPDEVAEGTRPVVWSPAASAWASIVNQRLDEQGKPPVAPTSQPFMLTPLVIAMPKPMADALGYPAKPVGFADIVRLARDPQGWAAFGHPEWGAFKLGKTNPNFSTSGLNFTIAQYYAATGKTSDLTIEDLGRPDVASFASGVESSVVHYGDITMTFLNNWFRADARGTALTYASAVAIEEKSVIDYNAGNPDGVLDAGEVPRTPKVPLVAIYPSEGTLFSDNPFIILDAPWVSDAQRAGAEAFRTFVNQPDNQRKVLEFGFRPGNPAVAVGAPIVAANGVDPDQPQTLLQVPDPPVLVKVLDAWATQRKTARVLLVMDVSGSMGDPAVEGSADTKLDLAKRAAINALDQFKADDEVGLRIFSTDLGPNGETSLDLVPVAPIGPQRQAMKDRIDALVPTNATPLYAAAGDASQSVLSGYDATKINAVVLLTDGRNDDGESSDDADQLDALIATLRRGSEGEAAKTVRIFPIAYGADADLSTLRRIAEATDAAVYDAKDPSTIDKVFAAVISNF